jgi:hypothetical protein
VKTRIPKRFGLDPIHDIQVLCPMNRGSVGARSLNIELQAALNPAGDRKVERFGWTFAPGDKVMQIENDYDKEVYNGDVGYIDHVDPNAGEVVAVSFDGRSVTYGFEPAWTLLTFESLQALRHEPAATRTAIRIERDLLTWCTQHDLPVMAYSPLGGENSLLITDRTLAQIGTAHGCSAAAVALAWAVRSGNVIAIPEAGSLAHVKENAVALSLTLRPQELQTLDAAFPGP